ncbi:MAG: tetratricopeptide (TPR) repeat protein [Flavobacteriaceae bacterium]|jgi:tetratricopeptide (TPR) repeat protein
MTKWIAQLFFAVLPWTVLASSNFDEGIKAFKDKDYATAIEKFQASLIQSPDDVASFYNLGLAYHENKSYGKAIWSFEKVLKLSPSDGDAKKRIEQSYTALDPSIKWKPRLNRLESALYGFSGSTWSFIAIAFSILLSISIIAFIRSKNSSTRRLYFIFGGISLTVLIFSIVIAAGSSSYSTESNFAIITKESIPTYKDSIKTTTIKLSEGDRLQLLDDTTSDFITVSSVSGDTYLVKYSDVDLI